MSFKLGTFNTTSIDGFKAHLTEWPVLPVELALDDLPAGDGALFYKSRFTSTEWVFNLELTGSSVSDVMDKADTISQALNPQLPGAGGPKDFTPNALEGWVWKGIIAGIVSWERDEVLWFSDRGISRLKGTVTISTPNPYGYAVMAPVVLSAPGALALKGTGNTRYYPTLEFKGVLSSTQRFVAAGMQIYGPLTAAQTLVLDFENMDFYIKTTATGAKVANVADRFNPFSRVSGVDNTNVNVSVNGGTFTQVVARVSARRI